jgi:hypothetical protein
VDASEPTVKFVAHAPITRPRSCLWNHAAIEPTFPDQPVACARPFTAIKPISIIGSSETPKATQTRTDSPMPMSTFTRGPSSVPMPPAKNCPMA